jgi:hypothetical protein
MTLPPGKGLNIWWDGAVRIELAIGGEHQAGASVSEFDMEGQRNHGSCGERFSATSIKSEAEV